MKSREVRRTFLDFFKDKLHKTVPSAPMVIKNDPTLMFTNAGMNQFKDIFLGNKKAESNRIANTQKCLRVSGKHNDLEEVGHDTYHHTMFEMLGNWSFGDYFKKEAIEWAWELLHGRFGIQKDRLYASVFEGDNNDGTPADEEAFKFWKELLPIDQILYGDKKDNFWEMGETGPCGPCSEIHIDLRKDAERKKIPGRELVNKDHPLVIEIWNLVFIEFNRMSDGKLMPLPQKHVDTGMGFERLCMVLQDVKSNYDTDVFQPIIKEISAIAGKSYGDDIEVDISMRVIADHLRAVAFAIADGQLPSNVGAGYVIRRILRRAVRYGYTFLDIKQPFINTLVDRLEIEMGEFFPELTAQKDIIKKVIAEEEASFLRTLAQGIKRFETYIDDNPGKKEIDGAFAFELFDTFGFPVDLTQLMAKEKGWTVDMDGFAKGLKEQKERSRSAATKDSGDWIVVRERKEVTAFVGYDEMNAEVSILRYRKVHQKNKVFYEIILDKTPFYAESGGQVGDTGILKCEDDTINILDTKKENDLIIHITDKEPKCPECDFSAVVDVKKRISTMSNHTASHILHHALRNILGDHVEQKGSYVDEKHLRFDFSHYEKIPDNILENIERAVNEEIRKNLPLDEHRAISMKEAEGMGALAFFGEKYGDEVRVIRLGGSVELCGGTHVDATGQIGFFKITSESAIAAGIRRIEAITGYEAQEYLLKQDAVIRELKKGFKTQDKIINGVKNLVITNDKLQKLINTLIRNRAIQLAENLKSKIEVTGNINFLGIILKEDPVLVKNLAFAMVKENKNLFLIIGNANEGKASLTIALSKDLVDKGNINAGKMIRDLAPLIKGGGGGQPHFATSGGKDASGLEQAIVEARKIVAQS